MYGNTGGLGEKWKHLHLLRLSVGPKFWTLSLVQFCVILGLCEAEADVKLECYNWESGILSSGFSHPYWNRSDPKHGIACLSCPESFCLWNSSQPGSTFVFEPYIYNPNLWSPAALQLQGGYCVVPLGTRISADVPACSPAQVLSERVTACKAKGRSLKRIKIGLISKLGTIPVLFGLIHTHYINTEQWWLFLRVLSTYSLSQCQEQFCNPWGKDPKNHCTKVFYCSFQLGLVDSSIKTEIKGDICTCYIAKWPLTALAITISYFWRFCSPITLGLLTCLI